MAAVGGNAVLAELADIVGRRFQWFYRMVAPERGHGPWAEHAEMIEAIESGDAERAQVLARKHTERTRLAYHRSGAGVGVLREPDHAHRVRAYGFLALSISSISPRLDMMLYDPSARYSRMIVDVPSSCV